MKLFIDFHLARNPAALNNAHRIRLRIHDVRLAGPKRKFEKFITSPRSHLASRALLFLPALSQGQEWAMTFFGCSGRSWQGGGFLASRPDLTKSGMVWPMTRIHSTNWPTNWRAVHPIDLGPLCEQPLLWLPDRCCPVIDPCCISVPGG